MALSSPKDDESNLSFKLYAVRLKYLAYTLIQLVGFALVLFGVFRMFQPTLLVLGVVELLPRDILQSLPQANFLQSVLTIALGAVVVWASTSTRRF